jgi:tetratricopeptide (TPR) repeat protein
MARAAAKRRPAARPHDDRRRHKDAGGQRFEDTLFFNRLRKQAKWVFVFLALVFGLGFVVFGVGSSGVSGLSDIFNGIRSSGGGSASISKGLKETQKNPKSPQAWQDLATAYEAKGQLANAVSAWTTYTNLRPKSVDGLNSLANDYQAQFSSQTAAAQAAQVDAQSAQTTNFGAPPTTPLGRALGSVPDPISQAVSNGAAQRFNAALQARAATASTLLGVYQRIATLQPGDPTARLQLAGAAQQAGVPSTAIAAYKQFIKLAPYDNQVPYAKQQIKALESQLAGAPHG